MKVKWLLLVVVIGLMWLTLPGCAAPERGNLGLSGYHSLEVNARIINGGTYAPDKLASSVQNNLRGLIAANYHWSPDAKPRARLTVEITRVVEPTDGEQTVWGRPYQIDYRLVAEDAESGAPLGAIADTTKVAIRSGIIPNLIINGVSGLGDALAERRFESGWSDATRQNQILGKLAIDMERHLNLARGRPPANPPALVAKPTPPVLSKPPEAPAKREPTPEPVLVNRRGRLVVQAQERR